MTDKQLQARLNTLGYDAGPADGIVGKRTIAAIKQFQTANGLAVDGIAGNRTRTALFSVAAVPYVRPHEAPRTPLATGRAVTPAQSATPRQANVVAYYGQPGSAQATAGRCEFPFPFRIAWDPKQTVSHCACNTKVAKQATELFAAVHAAYGTEAMKELGLDLFGGCFNNRPMRGGSKPSMHAYGIAWDLDPERNQLKWNHKLALFATPKYEKFWDIVEQHGATSLGRERDFDWMHFQFARL